MGSILASARRPAQRTTAEDMEVGMADRLAAFPARVGDEAMARGVDALLASDLGGDSDHLASEGGIGVRDGGQVIVVSQRNDEHVHGSLGFDVAEGEHALGPGHDVGRNVTGGDTAEQAVGHVDILARTAMLTRSSSGMCGKG